MKFRKKPVVIDAVRFTDHHITDHLFGGVPLPDGVKLLRARYHRDSGEVFSASFGIKTLEGWMIVEPGDWVIRGIKGEYYPCKPDIFAATYEAAE